MSAELVIIDYKMGNLRSVQKAFEKIGSKAVISNDKDILLNAKKLVLPGVGAFKDGISNLQNLGLVDLLTQKVLQEQTPLLGICLGMQLLANKSSENGQTNGLGWIDAKVVKFDSNNGLKVPHVGWNDIIKTKDSPLLKNIPNGSDFYFVHSYYMDLDEDVAIAMTNYGSNFVSSIHKNNIYATQFHPEKSQIVGLQLLKNFLEI